MPAVLEYHECGNRWTCEECAAGSYWFDLDTNKTILQRQVDDHNQFYHQGDGD